MTKMCRGPLLRLAEHTRGDPGSETVVEGGHYRMPVGCLPASADRGASRDRAALHEA
jgi:hypothetical protein